MGNCVSIKDDEPKNNLIIDVQQIIADDSWQEFVKSSHRKCKLRQAFMKRSDYIIEVPMNYYHFEVTKQEFESSKSLPSLNSNESARQVSSQAQTSRSLLERTNPDQVGLKTQFKNDTNRDQTYNFRMEKTRKAAVQVNYQKGFSIGGNTNFSIGLPKVLTGGELSSEISMTYEVTSVRGQTFEESLTTEATSEITVAKHSHCIANVIMEERRLLANFKIWVTMSMPAERAVVQIKNKTGRVVFLKEINNLSMLFEEDTHLKDDEGQTRVDAIQFIIHGFVDGMQLANHYIHLKGRDLPSGGKGGGVKGRAEGSGDRKDESIFPEVEVTDLEVNFG